MDEHARPRLRKDHSERLHDRQDRRAARPDRARAASLGWNHDGRHRQLRQLLDACAAPVDIVPGPAAPQRRSACSSPSASSQTGSLFSADAWNNITFTAGEVKDPRRNIPLSLALGTGHRHRAVPARERRLPGDAAVRADPACARRPRGDGDAQRDLPGRRRDAHGGRDHDLDLRLQQRPDPRRRARVLRDGARRPVLPARPAAERGEGARVGLVLQGVWAAFARPAAHVRPDDAARTATSTATCSTT